MKRRTSKRTVRAAINRIVKRIAARYQPQRVILFGSQARGDATTDSDVDLLVVMDFKGTALDKGLEILQVVRGTHVPVDVFVTRPEDFAWRKDVVGTLEWPAAREGKVLYART